MPKLQGFEIHVVRAGGIMAEETGLAGAEWSVDEWTNEWTIHVGRAYHCAVCGAMGMVTKGGIGVMEPKCCNRDMALVAKTDEIR